VVGHHLIQFIVNIKLGVPHVHDTKISDRRFDEGRQNGRNGDSGRREKVWTDDRIENENDPRLEGYSKIKSVRNKQRGKATAV
jgi:hypothetical protein